MGPATVRLRRTKQDRVIRVSLHVLLEILGALKCLAAEIALVRLQRDVNANMRGDVIALHGRRTAVAPLAGQVQVVGALAADMALANVVLRNSEQAISHVTVKCLDEAVGQARRAQAQAHTDSCALLQDNEVVAS